MRIVLIFILADPISIAITYLLIYILVILHVIEIRLESKCLNCYQDMFIMVNILRIDLPLVFLRLEAFLISILKGYSGVAPHCIFL